MLKLHKVSFAYEKEDVLKDFCLEVGAGECVCLSGPSGCGKTTVLRLIMGLEKQNTGAITVNGKISAVFQEDRLLPWLSVWNNIKLTTKEENLGYAESLLKEVGLGNIKNAKLSELSGGMKRRVAIIRALSFGGDILILDEAFNGIDDEYKRIIANIIKRDFLNQGKAVIMVSHIAFDQELLSARIVNM